MNEIELEVLLRGLDEVIPKKEFLNKIKKKEPLRVKLGLDPTAPDLHLGHTVILNKLRLFQKMGHTVIFLIGDFTGQVGDPSGVNETRPVLTEKEIKKNAKTYEKQVYKILDRNLTEVRFNSEWMSSFTPTDGQRTEILATVQGIFDALAGERDSAILFATSSAANLLPRECHQVPTQVGEEVRLYDGRGDPADIHSAQHLS